MIGVIGIILSLVLLIWLAYRGITVLILAPLLALFAVLLNGNVPLLASYSEVFMSSFAGYAKSYFPLFLLGAIFGKLMEDSGSAQAIAGFIAKKLGQDKAILAIVLACAVLTYGGVSLFVVAFAVFPVASALFRAAQIPKRLIPGSIALGSFTFTMTALPGSPQIQNAIPMPFFGTDTYAAPILGLVGAVIMFGGGILWLNYRARQAQQRGEGYSREASVPESDTPVELALSTPPIALALLPIGVVLILNFICSRYLFPSLDTSYLALDPYKTTLDKVLGQWSLIVSVSTGIVLVLLMNRPRLLSPINTVNAGAIGSLLAIINTCSEVGYGNVIASLPAFKQIQNAIMGISSNPLISEAVSISTLAGVTGSASGGMSIALNILGKQYLEMAQASGLNPEVLHRIATLACGSLDSLPHNGAVITLLAICGLTHRQSYADIGMVTVVLPVAATVSAVVLGSLGVV
jgi:H+/gluconate symporter-like permease